MHNNIDVLEIKWALSIVVEGFVSKSKKEEE